MARVKVEMPNDEDDDAVANKVVDSEVAKNQSKKLSLHGRHPGSQKIASYIVIVIVLILILLLVNATRERDQLKQELSTTQNAGVETEDEATVLKREIEGFIELPVDEKPTIATVTDITKVKDQPFFAHAQNGDKVLLFSKAGKAILYRPSTKKIIELAPIDLKNPAPSSVEE